MHCERDTRLCGRADGLPTGRDTIDAWDDFLSERGGCTIDPNLALGDERLGRAPGTDAGIGEIFLEADGFG